MVSTRTGDADASNGSSDKANNPFMMEEIWPNVGSVEMDEW